MLFASQMKEYIWFRNMVTYVGYENELNIFYNMSPRWLYLNESKSYRFKY